jgi:pantoate--beta-alanine ligase
LDDSQRAEAAQLHAALSKLVVEARSGRTDWTSLEREAQEFLAARGWQPDYVAIRRQSDLREPSSGEPLVALAAARLGGTRLIDNLEI